MSELHLHIHVPVGTELVFDGEKLTCRPITTTEVKSDMPPVSLTPEELAAFFKAPE